MTPTIKTIDRYILEELLQPFLFGLSFFVVIWLIDLMMDLVNLIFSKGVPPYVTLLFFIYSLPPTLVISFPMATLMGNLVAFGRLSSDSEITALKAGGYSFGRIVAPAVLAGLFITGLTLLFNEKVVPVANDKFSKLFRREVTLKRPLPKVSENRFFEVGPGRKFFAQRVDQISHDMFGVVMYEGQAKNFPRVIEAKRARLGDGACSFWDGRISDFNSAGSDYHYTYFQEMQYPIDTHYVNPDDVPDSKNPRRMNIIELYRYIQDLKDKGLSEKALNQNWIEFWTKMSIPFASLVFVLIGAPLGTSTSRSGTSIGVGLSVVIIFVYYVLFAAGKAFANGGYLTPFLGVWLPNIIIGGIGLKLIFKAKE
ncbi:MAG: LptF/LptG family permease [Candidatus Ozemobacteraceae bacterium]